MKNVKVIIGLAICAVVVIALGKVLLDSEDSAAPASSTQPTQATELHIEYPDLDESHNFERQPASVITSTLREGTGIIFLGFKECPWCQKLAPLVNEAAKAANQKVYYLDIRQARENNTTEYQELISILSPYLPKDEEGQVRIYVPDLSIVKNGEIVWRHENESVTEDEKTPETYWTEERQRRAVDKITQQLNNLNEEAIQ